MTRATHQHNSRLPATAERYVPLDRRRGSKSGWPDAACLKLTPIQLLLLCLAVAGIAQLAFPLVQHHFKSFIASTSLAPSQFHLPTAIGVSLLCDSWLKSSLRVCEHNDPPSPDSLSARLKSNTRALTAFFDDPLIPTRGANGEEWPRGELVIPAQNDDGPNGQREWNPWLEAEALQALQAARRNRLDGNLPRAKAIIEHAYSLSPHHPDILTEYGAFMEAYHDNVVEAEGLYTKALHLDAHHSEALTRRARTLPLVEEIDNRMLAEIHRKRDTFLKIPRADPGLKRAMRESYFQHVYHTVALEGNTMSLMQTRSILETRMAVGGKSIIEHNEILGMDAALRFLNQSLTHVGEIRLDEILAIHRRVMGFVDLDSAGVIRTHQVFVGSFTPPQPHLIADELEELISWLNDEDTLRIDPVKLAALAHYKLVYIHPFSDGNGRTSRLLMNFILMQAGFPPVIIPVHERSRYYHALLQANEGDLRPFIRFIAEMTDLTLESFITTASICEPSDCANGRHSAGLPSPSLVTAPLGTGDN